MMNMKRLLSLLLAAALCLAASPCAGAHYEAFDHPDVPFADMPCRGADPDAVDRFCARFVADPLGEYDALVSLYDEIYTQRELTAIRMYRDPTDEALSAENLRVQDDFSRAADAICAALGEALDGENADALAARMPEGEADAFRGYEASDDTAFEAQSAEYALVQEYYSLPYDDAFEDRAAAIYLKLVDMRRESARRMGYDSYADYAYMASFSREYDSGDMQELERVVKQRLAPLYVRCKRALARRETPWDDDDVPAGTEILDTLRAHMGDVSPELTEAMDYLCRNGLSCIGGEPMFDTGFTTLLPAYRAPFLFNYVDTRFSAFQTTVHEFGHFNAAYHDPTPMLYQYSNFDVSEIQSQALELLFIPCLQDILAGDRADARDYVALCALTEMLSSVVEGCLYDEFEQTVYDTPGMTADGLFALEEALCHAYGLDELYAYEPFWCYISHLFEQPFYYISYAVSALPALDIWLRSCEDRAAAVDVYLSVSAVRTDAWFLDVLYDNGLCDVTDPAEVRALADDLREQLDPLIDRKNHTPAYVAAASCAVLAAGLGLYVSRRKRKIIYEPEL